MNLLVLGAGVVGPTSQHGIPHAELDHGMRLGRDLAGLIGRKPDVDVSNPFTRATPPDRGPDA